MSLIPLPLFKRQDVLAAVIAVISERPEKWHPKISSGDCRLPQNVVGRCRTRADLAGHVVHEAVASGIPTIDDGSYWVSAAITLLNMPMPLADVLFDGDFGNRELLLETLHTLRTSVGTDMEAAAERIVKERERQLQPKPIKTGLVEFDEDGKAPVKFDDELSLTLRSSFVNEHLPGVPTPGKETMTTLLRTFSTEPRLTERLRTLSARYLREHVESEERVAAAREEMRRNRKPPKVKKKGGRKAAEATSTVADSEGE